MNQFEAVESYIQSFDGNAKEYLEQLRSIIHKAIPKTDELINYNVAEKPILQ